MTARIHATRRRLAVAAAVVAVATACVPDPGTEPGATSTTTTSTSTSTTTTSTTTTSTTTTSTTTTTLPGNASKVYVLARNLGAVVVVNGDTMAIERTIDLGVAQLTSISVAGNSLWYAWGGSSSSSGVGRYNLSTDANDPNVITGVYSGLVRVQPERPGILYVGEQGLSPANIRKFDVTLSPPVLLARTEHGPMGSNLGDFEISADGTKIWSACGSPYEITEIRTSDMKLSGKVFPTGPYPTGVARTPTAAGELVVGGTNSVYDPDVHVFAAANPAVTDSHETGKWSVAGNVATNADGSRVYAVHAANYPFGGAGELVTVARPSGTITRTPITTASTFNNGVDVDTKTGRVWVATSNSVSVFSTYGAPVATLSAIAGPSAIVVVRG